MATSKKPRTKAPENETKRQKFVRLVNKRHANVIRNIRNIGKLGTSAYERSPEDIAALHASISGELKSALDRLAPRSGDDGSKTVDAGLLSA